MPSEGVELELEHNILPSPKDLVRIVPLHLPKELTRAAGAAPAQLTYRGGALIQNVEVFSLYWGVAWNKDPLLSMKPKLDAFYQFVLGSALLDQLAEYNVPQYTIGHGKFKGSTTIVKPRPKLVTTDAAIQHFVQQEISANTNVPKPNANSLYFVYLPPGVAVVQGGARSCQAFCGYHDSINGQIYYAVMPYPNCAGCLGGLAAFDSLTSTSSHELSEAITDPVPGQGWYDDANGEIGDICAWATKQLGQYTIQLEWSNNAGQCV